MRVVVGMRDGRMVLEGSRSCEGPIQICVRLSLSVDFNMTGALLDSSTLCRSIRLIILSPL